MSDRPTIALDQRFVLTDAGREVLLKHELCNCKAVFRGRQIECLACGTLLGFVSQIQLHTTPQREGWR